MKKINQVEILFWAKTKHNLNTKYVRRSLGDKDFDSFCLLLHKIKQIGSTVSIKDVVKEYIAEYGIEYMPKSFAGVGVDMDFFFNTHPKENEFIEVDLYHILLTSWCRPTRENFRRLKNHLKELGYELKNTTPTYSLKESTMVQLKREYPLSLPLNLKRYMKPVEWCKSICTWLYNEAPPFVLNGKPYEIKDLGARWEAYFNRRFNDLFIMSEIEFIYKHPKVRNAYEKAPPVFALCELVVRDVFKPTKLKDWIHQVLLHTEIETYIKEPNTDVADVFLTTIYDEICGRLSKTMVKGDPTENYEIVSGWNSIIVLCYVQDILTEYKELL